MVSAIPLDWFARKSTYSISREIAGFTIHNYMIYIAETNGATAVLPYRVRARPERPSRLQSHRNEIEVIARPSHWHIGDAAELVRSAGSKALANWGKRRRRAGEVSDSSHSGGGILRNLSDCT